MGTATTTQAGRAAVMMGDDSRLTENATSKFARKREEARQAAETLNGRRADTTTPLVGRASLETLPEPPAPARPIVVLSTTVIYRGRQVTITNDGMTLDQFCDMLDKRFGVAQ
jgi:hypothetical protein